MLNPLVMKTAPLKVQLERNYPMGTAPPAVTGRTMTGSHFSYAFADPYWRVTQQSLQEMIPKPGEASHRGVFVLNLLHSATGDTFWLPYGWNEIHSVEIPAQPALGEPRTVITANLSGCCIYLERKATGNIVMYHANTVANSPDAVVGATQPTYQTGGALVALNKLFSTASPSYAGATTGTANLPKSDYNRRIDGLMLEGRDLKENKDKTISFAAGTTVAAFFLNGAWEFWYQTYARVEHYYVDQKSKAALASEKVYHPYKVVEARKFYP